MLRCDLLPDCFLANTRFNANAMHSPTRAGARRHSEATSHDPAERLDLERLADGFFVRWQ
jgi:hypothetical protein